MKVIQLSRGLVAKVDDEDFAWLSQWKWCALKTGGAARGERIERFYACRVETVDGKQKMILMHRFIKGAVGREQKVDHGDRDTLNNQRNNLRLCTGKQNDANRIGWSGETSSKYRGVSWDKVARKWRAGYRGKYLGLFSKELDASARVDSEMIKLSSYGDLQFVRTNQALGG